jgi:hypothetical protein
MKKLAILSATLASVVLLMGLTTGVGMAAGTTVPTAVGTPAEPDHIVTGTEIQSQIDQKIQSEASDRQAIRELLARPEVRRVAGSAGLNLKKADAAVGVLSGPELARLATQARQANSDIVGGKTITMTWTMVIIVVVALVVLISVL